MLHHNNVSPSLEIIKTTKNGRKLFFSFFRRNPKLMSTALSLMIINIFLILLPAVLVGRSLDILVTQGYGKSFVGSVSLILIIAGLAYVTSAISNYAFAVTAFATERDVRNEFFDSIVNSSMQFHDRNNSSVLLSLGMNEIHFLAAGSMMTGVVLRSIISASMVMIYISPFIGVIPLIIASAGFLVYFIYVYYYARRVVPVRKNVSDSLANLTAQSQEIFRGIEVIRSMSSETKEIKRFEETNDLNAKYSEQEGKLRAFYVPGLLLLLVIGFLFSVGVFRVINGFITVSQLVEIIGLLIGLQMINFTIPNIVLAIRGGMLNADRISGKINEAESLTANQNSGNKILDTIKSIEFDKVTFAYPGQGKAVLKRVSFKVTQGQNIVLLGGPGSGKSSVMKLLLGFYEPQHGKIKINGIDLHEYDPQSLRSKISLVEQDIYLFGDTIRENIRFAESDANEESVEIAAKLARADQFIEQLDKGYDTVIGERGVTLSGGQRQRLAIVRAIMSHPQVLLLDDSTSALDAKTELEIFESLSTVSSGITSFTIAHRISVIQQSDLILFLHKGVLVGKGQHVELYENNQTYRWMYDLLPDDRDNIKIIEQSLEEN